MDNSKLSLHDITKIEIDEQDSVEGSEWRHITFTAEDGSDFTVVVFPSKKNVEPIPVTFTRDLKDLS